QPAHRFLVAQAREGEAAVGDAVGLGQRDQRLGDAAQFLGLGQRRADQLVLEQRRRHVLEHRLAVAAGPVEFATRFHVTHDDFSLFYRYGNPAPASGLPRITRYSEPLIKRLFSRSAATEGRYNVSKNLTSGSRQ